MERPKNYDKVGSGSWTPIELGGHQMRILNAEIIINKNGGEMIVVSFDFDKGDKQEGYFMNEYKNDTRNPKKWPHKGKTYINILDSKTGECSKSFKSLCTSVERSNNGFIVEFADANDNDLSNEAFCAQFKNKLVGGVFGMVENDYNGVCNMRPELRWFCELNKVAEQKVPEPKMLGPKSVYRPRPQTAPKPAPTSTVDTGDILF